MDHAKKSFYTTFNAVFGKVGSVASENIEVELLKTKCFCFPALLGTVWKRDRYKDTIKFAKLYAVI